MANGDFSGIMPDEVGIQQTTGLVLFKPNVQLMAQAMGTRQQQFNTNLETLAKARAKVDEVNALAGYDQDRHAAIAEDYDNKIGEISDLYGGDLSLANTELRSFSRRVAKDFGKHGEMTALNSRAVGFYTNKTELDKRLQERKITQGQYWKLLEQLEKTKDTGIGQDRKAWKGWNSITPMDAIDFHTFTKDFIALKKASYSEKGYEMKHRGDFIEFTKVGHETINKEELQAELMEAWKNEAGKTGQLRDDFDYNVYRNKMELTKDTYINKFNTNITTNTEHIKQLSTLNGTALQEYIRKLGVEVKVDGVIGNTTKAAKLALLDRLEKTNGVLNDRISQMNTFSSDHIKEVYFQDFIDSEARRLSDPYASAASYDKITIDSKFLQNPWVELEIAKKKKELEEAKLDSAPLRNEAHGETFTAQNFTSLNKNIGESNKRLEDLEKQLAAATLPASKQNIQVEINRVKGELLGMQSRRDQVTAQMAELGYKSPFELLKSNTIRQLNGAIGEYKHLESTSLGIFHVLPKEERMRLFQVSSEEELLKKFNSSSNNVKISILDKLHSSGIGAARRLMGNEKAIEAITSYRLSNLNPTGVGDKAAANLINSEMTSFLDKTNQQFTTEGAYVLVTDEKGNNKALQKVRTTGVALIRAGTMFTTLNGEQVNINGSMVGKQMIDLGQIKDEDVGLYTRAQNGKIFYHVKMRDTEGKTVKDSKGKDVVRILAPADQSSARNSYSMFGIEEMKAAKTGLVEAYTKKGLTEYERKIMTEKGEQRFMDALTVSANSRVMPTWQGQGVSRSMDLGEHRFVVDPTNPNTTYAVVHGVVKPDGSVSKSDDKWSLVRTKEGANGRLVLTQDVISLPIPSGAAAVGASQITYGSYADNLEDVAARLEFLMTLNK